jgi:transposase
MADKQYRDWQPDQTLLFPPSPRDWLPEEHLVWFILDLSGTLDLSLIEAAIQEKDPRGNRPYPPRMMVALLLYGYCIGIRSSRAIYRATWNDVAFRAIAAGFHPHFTSIAEFRENHREALAQLFQQSLQLARKAGLVSLGHVAIDGTKIQGNTSKHKAMSYERMRQTEARLKQQVDELLKRAEAEDQQEDQTYGKGKDKEDLPAEMKRRTDRLAVIARS